MHFLQFSVPLQNLMTYEKQAEYKISLGSYNFPQPLTVVSLHPIQQLFSN